MFGFVFKTEDKLLIQVTYLLSNVLRWYYADIQDNLIIVKR